MIEGEILDFRAARAELDSVRRSVDLAESTKHTSQNLGQHFVRAESVAHLIQAALACFAIF
jgi:hypothetical protein